MSRALPQVKNRAPAQIQVTAEQLVLEAKDRGLEEFKPGAKQFIKDDDELLAYQKDKRADFESQINRHRERSHIWCRYALWEAELKEFDRARSIFERALQFNYKDESVWMKYGEMEMKAKFVNHARNVWDRAVTLLPRVDQFWYKYTYMEELIGAVDATRAVFERWMQWEPEDDAWSAFVKFEMRQGQINLARGVMERYVFCHSSARAYLKYARWEEKQNDIGRVRAVFETAVEVLPPMIALPSVYLSFAAFEERCHESERARVILNVAAVESEKAGLDSEVIISLRTEAASFERRHGSAHGAESAALEQRRKHYEARLLTHSTEYDTWLDLARLEESSGEGAAERLREVYGRAVQHIPPIEEKQYWRRYVYLWIFWAIYEEMDAQEPARARDVYAACLKVIPHKKFTFGKIWFQAAELEVRQKRLSDARKILGLACGKCALLRKASLYRKYILLEQTMGEIDRCRSIYTKWLEVMPDHSPAWKGLASMEMRVGEVERARAVFELALQQEEFNAEAHEGLWNAYIAAEREQGDVDCVRALYERLIKKSSHVRVWVAYGSFEAGIGDTEKHSDVAAMRAIFERGYSNLKQQGLKNERVMLLNSWRECELVVPGGDVGIVEVKLPQKVKVRRAAEDGSGVQEMYDYLFPDEQSAKPGLKLLEKAMMWKAAAAAAAAAAAGTSTEVEKLGDNDSAQIEIEDEELPAPPAATATEEIDIDDI